MSEKHLIIVIYATTLLLMQVSVVKLWDTSPNVMAAVTIYVGVKTFQISGDCVRMSVLPEKVFKGNVTYFVKRLVGRITPILDFLWVYDYIREGQRQLDFEQERIAKSKLEKRIEKIVKSFIKTLQDEFESRDRGS